MLNRPCQPIGFELSPDLGHVMAENDDVMALAGLVLDLLPQQRLGLETEAFEYGDCAGLIDGHLHHEPRKS